eukprot:gnl/TRDRNA2_/TRDRNA2_36483_c0_seq1.p1 gnl/TRDRNA2_/TRDRNA2_36483_c0~~gnl/TRDRNA2_/TRDRNA2_36483_c0_seq1.p1  ORF type:complete len:777 (-),score=128.17 gnl/TRDRNA2_/TRDRNA2_36483_c0_seq1:59-2347(-)
MNGAEMPTLPASIDKVRWPSLPRSWMDEVPPTIPPDRHIEEVTMRSSTSSKTLELNQEDPRGDQPATAARRAISNSALSRTQSLETDFPRGELDGPAVEPTVRDVPAAERGVSRAGLCETQTMETDHPREENVHSSVARQDISAAPRPRAQSLERVPSAAACPRHTAEANRPASVLPECVAADGVSDGVSSRTLVLDTDRPQCSPSNAAAEPNFLNAGVTRKQSIVANCPRVDLPDLSGSLAKHSMSHAALSRTQSLETDHPREAALNQTTAYAVRHNLQSDEPAEVQQNSTRGRSAALSRSQELDVHGAAGISDRHAAAHTICSGGSFAPAVKLETKDPPAEATPPARSCGSVRLARTQTMESDLPETQMVKCTAQSGSANVVTFRVAARGSSGGDTQGYNADAQAWAKWGGAPQSAALPDAEVAPTLADQPDEKMELPDEKLKENGQGSEEVAPTIPDEDVDMSPKLEAHDLDIRPANAVPETRTVSPPAGQPSASCSTSAEHHQQVRLREMAARLRATEERIAISKRKREEATARDEVTARAISPKLEKSEEAAASVARMSNCSTAVAPARRWAHLALVAPAPGEGDGIAAATVPAAKAVHAVSPSGVSNGLPVTAAVCSSSIRRLRGKQPPRSPASADAVGVRTSEKLQPAPMEEEEWEDMTAAVRESIGHTLAPPERGTHVRVRGDGWGGTGDDYLAVVTESDQFTFTVIRVESATGKRWEETHVLREHCTRVDSEPSSSTAADEQQPRQKRRRAGP